MSNSTTERLDGQLGNNSAGIVVQSEGEDYVDVSLNKSVSPSQIDALPDSTEVTYTFQVRKESGAAVPENIRIIDTLPSGITYVDLDTGVDPRWDCSATQMQTVSCTWDGGAPYGESNVLPPLRIKASVSGENRSTGDYIDNTGKVSVQDGADPNTTNDTSTARATFSNVAALSLTKAGPSRPVKKGEEFAYTLSVTNDGPMNILAGQTITLTDTPTAPLKLMSVNVAASAGWSCLPSPFTQNAGAPVTCIFNGGLAKGDVTTLVLNAQVDEFDETAEYVRFTNEATATTGGPGGRDVSEVDTSNNVIVSDQSADLLVEKTVIQPAPEKSGDLVTYLLKVTNLGPQTAQDITLTDTLRNLVIPNDGGVGKYPTGGFISANVKNPPAGTVVDCAASGTAISRQRVLTCSIDRLNLDEVVEIELTIIPRVTTSTPADGPATYTNSAEAYSAVINDPNLENNTPSTNIAITPLVDLTVVKEVSPSPADGVASGQPAIYTVTVQNLGPSSAQEVRMEDFLPENGVMIGEPTFGTGSGGGTCVHSSGESFDGQQGGTMTCTWPAPLSAQSQYVVMYTMRSEGGDPADEDAELRNPVRVSTATEEIRYDNKEDEVAIPLKPPALDVQIQMSHTEDGLVLGEDTVYTITVTNNSLSSSYATDVNITDLFPSAGSTATFSWQGGLQVIGFPTTKEGYASGVSGSLDANALCLTQPEMDATTGPLGCVIPLMAPGDSIEIKFTMKALDLPEGASVGTIFHTATVKPAETEIMPDIDVLANNSTTDRTSTSRTANDVDLGVTKAGPTERVQPGDEVTYTITVNNYGRGDTSPEAVMTDVLPAGLLFKSATSSAADEGSVCVGVEDSSDPVTCTVPAMPKGGETVFTIVAEIAKPYTGSYPLVNKAQIDAPGDTNPENDESTFETDLPPPPVASS